MENSEKLIQTVKDLNLKPIPKWRFTSKKWLIGILVFISLFIGGLAFSIILLSIQQLDFDLLKHMSHSRLEFFLGLLPFFWIILMMVFLIIYFFSIKNSRKGYKFSPAVALIINASFSILLGTLFFIGGGAHWLENQFEVKMERYESVQEKKIEMWSSPEEGKLSGIIYKVEHQTLYIKDFKQEEWKVHISNAHTPPSVLKVEGEEIKIRGKMLSDHEFDADELRPWGGNGKRKKGNGNWEDKK